MIKEVFGSSLREQRKKKGWTQEKTALESGVAYRFLQDIEGGVRQPSITTLFKLCSALNISPNTLLKSAWSEWQKTSDSPVS